MIETGRLIIRPLTYDQLVKYLRNDQSLESELHVMPSSRNISAALKEAFEETILPNVADPNKNYLYSTLWTAISKEENTMIGDLCIVGEPDEAGEIEIGYGTYDAYKNLGYMTEIVGGILEWTKNETGVKAVVASTSPDNPASSKVLEKNGFVSTGIQDGLLRWRKVVKA